jgi:hypothetical protein
MQMPMRRNLPVQLGGALNNGFYMQDIRTGALRAIEPPRGDEGAAVIMAGTNWHFGRSSIRVLP